jgi:hypothetical protein
VFRHNLHSFRAAAGPSSDLTTGQEHPESTSLQDQIRAALLARAKIKFSGASGGVVASGITADAATADTPTYGHVRAAMDVVFNDLDDALFDPHAEHRPCGVLDRYEAVGMLLGDACGLPSMPARPHGLVVGNKARKLPPKIVSEIEAAKKRAKRRGEHAAEAEAAVLCLPAGVKLPSAAECVAAAMPSPEPAPTAPESAPEAEPSPSEPPVACPHRRALEAMLGSEVAWDAIVAAREIEQAERQLFYDYDCDDNPIDHRLTREEIEVAFVRYRHALSRLEATFPQLNEFSGSAWKRRRPCPCGRGVRGAWPWVVQTPARGYCEQSEESRHANTPAGEYSCLELGEEREGWLWAFAWASPTKRAKIMSDGKPGMLESRYRETMDAILCEL